MGSISNRLKLARKQAGLSQGQVANLLGKHRPTISEIEAGRRRVSAEEVTEFARIYKVSTSWLMGSDAEEGEFEDSVQLAARELAKIKPDDLERVLKLLATMRGSQEPK